MFHRNYKMLKPSLFFGAILSSISLTLGQIKPYDLTIGVMLPFDDPYLKPLMGYETSAGAITLALDRVKRENLLPGANFRYCLFYVSSWSIKNVFFQRIQVQNCQCKEEVAAGFAVESMQNRSIDVMISSPCAPSKLNRHLIYISGTLSINNYWFCFSKLLSSLLSLAQRSTFHR